MRSSGDYKRLDILYTSVESIASNATTFDSCSEQCDCKDSASSVEVCAYHVQLPNFGGDSPHYACYIISERAKPLTIAEAIESIIDPAMQG